MKDLKEKAFVYALKNAIAHEGKANQGAIISGLFAEGLKREEVRDVSKEVLEVLKKVNSMAPEKQQEEFEKLKDIISERETRGDEMPELEDVPKTGIITRFSPSSSASAFHIGHIFTGMPTSLYVKKYGGKFYLRIEDTNPEKTVKECYETFPKEAEWIFGNVNEYYAQSDRMDKYYNFIEELISKGLAFVCTCKKEEDEESDFHEARKPCDCRNNSIKDNQEKWKKMLNKKGFNVGEAVLRFKSKQINLSNLALVDFPLARINEHPHPHVGKKYRVWPLMNLCVTYDDIEQKCTHIIRGKEHMDNAKRQEMIFEALGIKKPHTYFVGRYKFLDMEISKTKITERIKNGDFTGWDDIRLPLARTFKKRGYQPAAFEAMVKQRGLSEVDKVISQKDLFQILNNFNREIIRPISKQIEFYDKKSSSAVNKYSLLMDDASTREIYTQEKLKDEQIYFLKGIGFAKLNEKTLWFCHD